MNLHSKQDKKSPRSKYRVPDTTKISRAAYELPLLESLVELGGKVEPNGALYQRIAEKMGFVGKDMEYDLVHARDKWIYTLQWVRHTLVKQGDMDGSRRGIWAITEQGRQRIVQQKR
jgi:restriction system protein